MKNSNEQIKRLMRKDKGFEEFLKENGFKIDEDTKKAWDIIDKFKEAQKEGNRFSEKALLEDYKKISQSRWIR